MSLILTGNSSTITVDSNNGITFPNNTTQASAGVILQVVQSAANTQSTTTSSSYTSTGFSVSITPKFSTSRVLISFTAPVLQTGSAEMWLALYRGSTQITAEYKLNVLNWTSATMEYLDSPATTNSTTYTLYYKVNSGSGNIYVGTNTGTTLTNVFMTAKEVAA